MCNTQLQLYDFGEPQLRQSEGALKLQDIDGILFILFLFAANELGE